MTMMTTGNSPTRGTSAPATPPPALAPDLVPDLAREQLARADLMDALNHLEHALTSFNAALCGSVTLGERLAQHFITLDTVRDAFEQALKQPLAQ